MLPVPPPEQFVWIGQYEQLLFFMRQSTRAILQHTDKAVVARRPKYWSVGLMAIRYIGVLPERFSFFDVSDGSVSSQKKLIRAPCMPERLLISTRKGPSFLFFKQGVQHTRMTSLISRAGIRTPTPRHQ